jgi:hypothetical protein
MVVTINCPKCDGTIIITKMNCKIFRHAIHKDTGKQIGPHSKNKYIQKLVDKDKIYGCGCQFRIVDNVPILCDL